MKRKILIAFGGILSFLTIPSTVLAQVNGRGLDYTYKGSVDKDAFASLFALTWGGVFVIVCISWVVWIAISIWIYKDAKKHNVDSPALWAFIVFFIGVIGLLIYLLAARKTKSSIEGVNQKEPVGPVNTTA